VLALGSQNRTASSSDVVLSSAQSIRSGRGARPNKDAVPVAGAGVVLAPAGLEVTGVGSLERWQTTQQFESNGRHYDFIVDRASQVWWPPTTAGPASAAVGVNAFSRIRSGAVAGQGFPTSPGCSCWHWPPTMARSDSTDSPHGLNRSAFPVVRGDTISLVNTWAEGLDPVQWRGLPGTATWEHFGGVGTGGAAGGVEATDAGAT